LFELGSADFARGQQVTDRIREAAFKEALNEMIPGTSVYGIGLDGSAVKKRPTLLAMRDKASNLHFAQHGCDGGVREVSFGLEGFVDEANAGIGRLPEHFEDTQLKIAESEWRRGHRSLTTWVILPV
jgi:hypothetical protein